MKPKPKKTSPPPKRNGAIDPRLAAAIARGKIVRKKLRADEGGAIPLPKAARLLRISEAAVLKRWRTYRLIGWSVGKTANFPVWQFKGSRVLPGIVELLQIFRSDDQWRVLMYFLATRDSLNGERPLDLLRRGESSKVIEHATAYSQDGTWYTAGYLL